MEQVSVNTGGQEKVEELKAEGQHRLEQAGEFLNKAKDKFQHTSEAARERARQAAERAQDAYEKVADKSIHDVQHGVEDYCRQKPLKALVIAAGVGLLAGLLLRRR